MSSIDKDTRRKVVKPTDKKFFLGISDGYSNKDRAMFTAIMAAVFRYRK
ncbi:hypothetical protein UFOVP115_17 [uncultured Caudovirales phage]|uniref:Uncharacterized protein n=1 Tax=uncultured Caudovirales phage TaxID=2100421 RepID=A0A6J5L8U0_9CAUD|nr:hypothetical protein UFOVP115_17 [uncultured Caudovirales phage]